MTPELSAMLAELDGLEELKRGNHADECPALGTEERNWCDCWRDDDYILRLELRIEYLVTAHRSALRSASGREMVMDGWALVPIAPTPKMLEAGAMEAVGDSFRIHDEHQLERIWSEMLAARGKEGK